MKMSDSDVAWHMALWIGYFGVFCAILSVYPFMFRRLSKGIRILWLLLAASALMAFFYMFCTGGSAGGFLD